MGRIKMNIASVIEASNVAQGAARKVKTVKDAVSIVRRNLDAKILGRNGIDNSFRSLSNRLSNISSRVERIYTSAERSANAYWQSDSELNSPRAMSGRDVLRTVDSAVRAELANQFHTVKEIVADVREKMSQRIEEALANRDPLPSLRDYDMVFDVLETRTDWWDGVLYSVSRGDILTGVKSWYNDLIGRDNMHDTIYKNHIKKTIALTIDKESNSDLGKCLIEEIDTTLIGSVNGWNGIVEAVENGGEKYKYLKYMDEKAFNNLGILLSCGQEGIECFEIIVSDYSENIAKLTILRDALAQSYCDEKIVAYVDEVINEYNNKFLAVTDNIVGFTIDTSVDVGAKATAYLIPGGQLFAVATDCQKVIWNVLGVEDKGDRLMDVYASACYSGYVVNAYESYANKLRSGQYTPADVEKCEVLFEIAKEMKLAEYEGMREFAPSDMHDEIDEAIDNLQYTYMLSERFATE